MEYISGLQELGFFTLDQFPVGKIVSAGHWQWLCCLSDLWKQWQLGNVATMTPSKHICFIWKALFSFSHILPSCFAISSEIMKNNMHTIFFEQSFLFWKSHWTCLGLFCWCNTLFIVNNWSTRQCKVMGLFSVYNLYYLLFTIYNTLYIVNNWSTR